MNLDNLTALSRELLAVNLQLARLGEVKRDLEAHIRGEVGDARGIVKTDDGASVVQVTYRRTFKPEQARKVLATNRDLLDAITEATISATKAKAILPPALYEMCQVESATPVLTPKVGA